MKRRSVIAGLAGLSGIGSISAGSLSSSDSENTDSTMTREEPVRLQVSNTLSTDAKTSIIVTSGDEEFLTARLTSTPTADQEITVQLPTENEYELIVAVDVDLDSPDEVTLGGATVQADGSSLSTEHRRKFKHSDMTGFHVAIGGMPLLDIETIE